MTTFKFLFGAKDGGPDSLVWAYGFESKRFGSLVLLKFGKGSREAFHTHAFNAISWLLKGKLVEHLKDSISIEHLPSFKPIKTPMDTFHKVEGVSPVNWVLSIRGSWRDQWAEFLPIENKNIKLTHSRKEV